MPILRGRWISLGDVALLWEIAVLSDSALCYAELRTRTLRHR